MTRPEHYRSYSAVFPILLREGANGREVLLHLRQNTGYMDGCWDFAGSGHVDENETARQAVAGSVWRSWVSQWTRRRRICPPVPPGSPGATDAPITISASSSGNMTAHPPSWSRTKNAGLRWFPTEALPENISTAVEVMLRPCLRGQPYSEVIHDLPVTSI